MPKADTAPTLASQLAWFVGIWIASVAALGAVAFVLKLMIGA
jgi:hypothetical protein